MKIAVLITSVISPNQDVGLTNGLSYSHDRTAGVSIQERMSQTVFTVCNIRNTIPTADIFIVEGSSENFAYYFSAFDRTNYIHLASVDPVRTNVINVHPNKSYCENLMIEYFLNSIDIKQYDYIIKMSGRYCYDTFDIAWFNQDNVDKYLFKHPLSFGWPPVGLELVDNRAVDGPVYKQYCSAFYAVGREQFDHFRSLTAKSMQITEQHHHYFVEVLLYFYTRDLPQDKILHIPLRIIGWSGGSFLLY